jgi:hypothetical protein
MDQLTPQQAAKVFALHLFCQYKSGENVFTLTPDRMAILFEKKQLYKQAKLLLTPLDWISEAHSMQVVLIMDGCFKYWGSELAARGKYLLKNDLSWETRDYLASQGYAVPLFFGVDHPLNGKTAIELQLANEIIYTKNETSFKNPYR